MRSATDHNWPTFDQVKKFATTQEVSLVNAHTDGMLNSGIDS